MIELFKGLSQRLFLIPIFLYGTYPLIPERYESFLPILLILVCAFFYFKTPKKEVLFRPFLILSSLFFIYILSFAFSSNLTYGLKKIETSLSLIVTPMCYFLLLRKYPVNFEIVKTVFQKVFFTANIVYASLSLYLMQFYKSPKFLFNDSSFIRSAANDIPFVGEHPMYISIFFSLGIMCGLRLISDSRKHLCKLFLLSGVFFMAGMLIAIMSKGIIIALISAVFSTWFLWLKGRGKIKIIMVLIAILLLILLIPKQNNRFYELIDKQSFEKIDPNNSTNVRFHIFKASVQLIKESPIFGYGIGDVQNELDKKYISMGLNLPRGKFNSHNQYLFICLNSGLVGLIIFLSSMAYIIAVAFLKKDYFFLGVVLFFLVAFLFENILSRQSGVILFSFLISTHMLHNLNQIIEVSRKT